MKITFEKESRSKPDAHVVFVAAGGKLTGEALSFDRKTGGAIARAMKAEGFAGERDKTIVVTGPSGVAVRHIVVAGLGKEADLDAFVLEKIGGALVAALNGKKASSAQIFFQGGKAVKESDSVSALALGMLLGAYRFDRYRTREAKDKKPALKAVEFLVKDAPLARKAYDLALKTAEAVYLTRDLVWEAPNVLYPDSYANIIKEELSPLGIEVKILGRKEMQKLGMNALISVGQGSAKEERLVAMQYRGAGKAARNVAFVGKGITFDTGGISLKPGPGMEEMKWDMAGSAAVVGLMKLLASRGAKVNAVGVVALAENMPSGTASRPSDIVTTMSGQTVENNNTDAEGRLVLCDALWYTQETFKPDRIVDMATLTGAVIIALGHEYAGMFANDDKLAKDLDAAAKNTGERLWRMPMCDAWDKAIDSPAADMKNISGSRDAGSAIGAHFLKRFIKPGVAWAHLDIAGTAWAYKDSPTVPKGASAFGLRLLDRYVRDVCEKKK